jgi:hypothetical protein
LDEDDARAGTPRPEDVAALLGDGDGMAGALAEMGALAKRMETLTALVRSGAEKAALGGAPKKVTKRR